MYSIEIRDDTWRLGHRVPIKVGASEKEILLALQQAKACTDLWIWDKYGPQDYEAYYTYHVAPPLKYDSETTHVAVSVVLNLVK